MRALLLLVAPIGLIILPSLPGLVASIPALIILLILKGTDTDSDQAAADTDPIKPYGPYGIMIRRSQHPQNRNRS